MIATLNRLPFRYLNKGFKAKNVERRGNEKFILLSKHLMVLVLKSDLVE